MSFGFSVGDFLAIINLATQVRKQFSDAPKHFRDLSDDVRSLSVTLFDLAGEDDRVLRALGPNEAEHLRAILEASHHVLKDLESLVAKYSALEPGTRSQRKQHARRLWDRLTFDCEELRDVRRRLSSNVSILGLFLSNCNERKVGKSLNKLESYADEEERQRVLDWIREGSEKHIKQFQYLVRQREPNTRRWLFDSPEWHAWARTDGKAATLLCPGIPGAGKTYTSAMVIEQLHSLLRSDYEDVGVAYFFCNYKEYDHDEVTVAKSLLSMLLGQLPQLPGAVIKAHQIHRQCGTEFNDPDEVFDTLMTTLMSKSSNFIVIDALDELQSSARRPLISRLLDLQQNTAVNLFVTSRDLGNFDDLFPGATRITIQATEHDVHQYLSTHMRSLPLCVRKDPALQNDIKIAIVQAAGEMFLLADLHLRSLMNVRPSQKAVREALKTLKTGPSATTDAFENAMKRINDQPKETSLMAMRTLLLLTYARRPLTVDELCHAVAVEVDEQDGEFDPYNVPEMEDVLPSCAGLVVVQSRHENTVSLATSLESQSYLPFETQDGSLLSSDENTPGYANNAIVQLVHKSFQDYLSLTKSQWFPRAESVMATICRAYISACEGIESAIDRPFLDYAKSRWGYHHLKAEAESATTELDCDPNLPNRGSFSLTTERQSLSMQFGIRQLSKELGGMQELLFWACTEGRINLVEVLLTTNLDAYTRQLGRDSNDSDVSSDEITKKTNDTQTSQQTDARLIDYALSYSVTKNGNQAVVECLLAHGASLERSLQFPKEQDGDSFIGRTALEHAVGAGLTEMLSFLLNHPSIDAMLMELGKYQTRIRPHVERILVPFQTGSTTKQAMFPWLASPLPTLIWDTTPLFVAVYHDQDSCLDIILDWMRLHGHEASDDTWLIPLRRALLLGLQHGSVKTLTKLFRIMDIDNHLLNADTGPNSGQIARRHIGIALNSKYPLRTLLANEGVAIPQPDPCDANAISICTASSYTDVVQSLLSNNIDVQPQFLVGSLFRGNTSDVSQIANRLCSKIDSENLTRFEMLHQILFGALRQQMILHDRHWKRFDYLTSGSGDATDVDTFDVIWDTSVLDLQRSRLEWDFVDVILSSMTESEKQKDPSDTTSPNHIEEGPNVAACDKSGLGLQTLFLAVALRSRQLVEKLVRCEPSLVHEVDAKGRTALMAAVCTKSEDLTIVLSESLDKHFAASTINAASETGYSAIAYAVRTRNIGQVLRLLENPNFDVWSVFDEVVDGDYPFVWALDMIGDNTICESICKSLLLHPDPEKLSQATRQLRKLPKGIFLGEDRHRGYHEAWKPLLCYAVIHKRIETFKFLLQTGSDIDAPDGQGRTALSHAEEYSLTYDESRRMADILLAQGADPMRLDEARRFPLWYALNSHPGPTLAATGVHSYGLRWQRKRLEILSVDGPRFMRETEGASSTIFDLAVTRCTCSVLEFFADINGDTILPEYVGNSSLSPLAKMVLGLDVVLQGSPNDRPGDIPAMMSTWCANVKEFYTMLLNCLWDSRDIPDKDGKTALCHALDRLYAEHCDNSLHQSLERFHCSEALASVLFFIIDDQIYRSDSNPLVRNDEGYSPLDMAHELLDQLEQESGRKSDKKSKETNSKFSSLDTQSLLPDSSTTHSSAEDPQDARELAVETWLEALDGAINLLDALNNEENSRRCDSSGLKESLELDEFAIIDGRASMQVAIAALKHEWFYKSIMEARRLGTSSLWGHLIHEDEVNR